MTLQDPLFELYNISGFAGLAVEPTESYFELIDKFPQSNVSTLQANVTVDNAAKLLSDNGVPLQFDMLKMDIDS